MPSKYSVDGKEDTKNGNTNKLVGMLRYEKEMEQIGALLILTGLPEVIQPLTHIAALVNGGIDDVTGEPITVTTGLPFSALFGYVCCVATGVLSMAVGYAAVFHKNAGSKGISVGVSVFMQTAYILTVSSCMRVTRVASSGSNFDIPLGSLAVETDIEPNSKLIAAMGVIAIMAYWFGMLGSISFLLLSLSKFQDNKPEERTRSYYRGRMFFYSCILFLGGLSQLVIGAHLEFLYDLKGGPLPGNNTFIKVAMYIIRYPSIAMTVGCVQIVNAIWGMLRQKGILKADDGGMFVMSIWFGWFVQLVLQIMVQPSVLIGGTAAAAPPTLTAFAFGMNFMPAYLDSKSNTLPELEGNDLRAYYGLAPSSSDDDYDDDNNNEKQEMAVDENV